MNVTVTRRGAERVRTGHLWIYRSDITAVAQATGGSIVHVRDERGKYVGQAFYSDRSEIALRLLTSRQDEIINSAWWQMRVRRAAQRRSWLQQEKAAVNAYRLIYSEGDLLPSLIVDRYSDVLVLQTLSQGTEKIKDLLVKTLVEEFAPRAIIERNDVRVRELEGLEMQVGVLYGEVPDELEIVQHGVRFLIRPLSGQKTGAFLDQRENHQAARLFAHGRALDCFTFNGGFAMHLAKSCESVLGLDVSGEAITAARRNAELNKLHNTEFREANVFDQLREMETSGQRFDTIVLDPPAFAKNRASASAAARGYKEINLRALKLLNSGGVLVTCTCSYHMREQMFVELIAEAANDAKRAVQVVQKRMQAQDHPVLLGVPETFYLKCIIARVVD